MNKHTHDFYNKVRQDHKICTISNGLTVLRMLLTPFIVAGIFYEHWAAVFYLIIIAGLTDLFDGYLARNFNQASNIGKILDPIADKILTISSFSALAFLQSPSFPIPVWFVCLILCRELIIILGSYGLVRSGKKFEVSPTLSGKLTTLFQILFILWLFVCHFFGWVPAKTYYTLLIFLSIFSVLSLLQYITIGTRYLKHI
jgi:cardiolipin synthase